jgi:hypothetical protein
MPQFMNLTPFEEETDYEPEEYYEKDSGEPEGLPEEVPISDQFDTNMEAER